MSLSSRSRVALLAMLAGCVALVVSMSPALANPPVFEAQDVYGVGTGEGTECLQGTNPLCPGDIVEADFDGDGDLDLATANRRGTAENDVSVFANNGDGTYADGEEFLNGVSTFAIAAGDFDGDDAPDIVVADPDSGSPTDVRVLINESTDDDIDFGAAVETSSGGDFAVDLTVADFDGDDDLDVAVTNFSSNNAQILLGDGDGSFTNGPTLTVTRPFGLTAADFDGDGDPDLAVNSTRNADSSAVNNEVDIFINTGAAAPFTVLPTTTVTVGENPRQIAAGDFNDDDDLDFATTNGNSDNVSVVLGNGDGTFGEDETFPVGDNPRGITLADFDGDETLDIATQNLNSNNVSVLTNDGSADFAAPVNFAIGNQNVLGGIISADLSGDDLPDIAVTNFADDTFSVLINAVDPDTADCTIVGTPGNDILEGTNGDDVICGLGGNDTINGLGGNDTIRGGDGNDRLSGGNGTDTIDGGDGNDRADGGGGSDNITGGSGEDNLRGQDGNDTVNGGANDDTIFGGAGRDSLNGAGGNDNVSGDNADDTLLGGSGNDILKGGTGTDRISGNTGNDTLLSGTGRNDVLFGGDGTDRLNVRDGTGRDRADGGNGRDTCASDRGDTVVRCEVNNSRSAPLQK